MVIMGGTAFAGLTSFGVVPALINGLAEANGKDDHERANTLFSTCFFFLLCCAIVVAALFAAVFGYVDWAALVNAPPGLARETRNAVAVYAAIYLVSFPLGVVEATYTAYQELHINYSWRILAQAVSTFGMLMAVLFDASLPVVMLAFNGSNAAVTTVSGLWLVGKHRSYLRPRFLAVRRAALRGLTSSGAGFLVIMVSGLFVGQFVTLVIARTLSLSAVTPYEVTLRLVTMISGLWQMVCIPLWGAYGEARARGDWEWLWNTHKRAVKFTILAAGTAYIIVALGGQIIIRIWAGPKAVPPRLLLLLLCVYGMVTASNTVHGTLLNALGKIRYQAVAQLLCAMLVAGSVVSLTSSWGVIGAAVALVGATLVSTGWMLPRKARQEHAGGVIVLAMVSE
jgi:O-antigen/teichoic acid export membrane protein